MYFAEDGDTVVLLLCGGDKGTQRADIKRAKSTGETIGAPTMAKRTRKYEESLLEDLRDSKQAAAYLNAALAELDTPDGASLFLMALGDVIRAQGVSNVARSAELGRESLYKSVASAGNPKLKSLLSVLQVMGLRLQVEAVANLTASPQSRPRQAP